MILLQILLATLILWLAYIPAANIINRHRVEEYTGYKYYLGYAYLTLFLFLDVFYNYTYGALLFLELASNDRKTLTARLKHYIVTEPDSWRGKISIFMCKRMIEPFDYNHCALQDTK